MAFKVKDLTISIVPAEGTDPDFCDKWFMSPTVHTTYLVSPLCCPWLSMFTLLGAPNDPRAASESLAALKLQLNQAVAEIEKQQALLAASAKPRVGGGMKKLQRKGGAKGRKGTSKGR
jgi:hypothetical protein